jgi:hypothetical protein
MADPLTLGEMLERAPLSFVLVHIGALVVGLWLGRALRAIERRFRKS